MNKKIKKKVDDILYKSHKIRVEACGTDISKTAKKEAIRRSRQLLKQIKDLDLKIYNILKAEFDEQ